MIFTVFSAFIARSKSFVDPVCLYDEMLEIEMATENEKDNAKKNKIQNNTRNKQKQAKHH